MVPQGFCAHGALQMLVWVEHQGMVATHIAHTYCVYAHISLPHVTSRVKHNFKDKIINNVSVATAEYWTKSGALLSAGPWAVAQVTCQWRWLCRHVKILCEMLWSVKGNKFFQTISECLLHPCALESPKVINILTLIIFSSKKMGRTSETKPQLGYLISWWISWLGQYAQTPFY